MAKYRKILSDLNAPYIKSLVKIVETQSKTTLIKWVLDYSEKHILPLWNKYYPEDERPKRAIVAAYAWLSGKIKLPQAKPMILACHAAARAAAGNAIAQTAARAIGQAASTIHSARHSLGLPLYGALAVAYSELGSAAKWDELEKRAALECKRMEAALLSICIDNELNPANKC